MVLEILCIEPIYPQYSGVIETCLALRYWFFEVLGSESVNSAYWEILHAFLSSADFFFKINVSKIISRSTIRVSISLDPDQDQCFFRPDLVQNCLQMLSADDTGRQRVSGVGFLFPSESGGLLPNLLVTSFVI